MVLQCGRALGGGGIERGRRALREALQSSPRGGTARTLSPAFGARPPTILYPYKYTTV